VRKPRKGRRGTTADETAWRGALPQDPCGEEVVEEEGHRRRICVGRNHRRIYVGRNHHHRNRVGRGAAAVDTRAAAMENAALHGGRMKRAAGAALFSPIFFRYGITFVFI